jgi:IclR family KDG regulon transcriptional repressor
MDRKREFKRVPALDKCFRVLELFVATERPLRISEIARTLDYNKSTVYNILHTLTDLDILEHAEGNTVRFGARVCALGRSAGSGSELISTVHPFLEEINRRTRLSALLGIRSDGHAVVLENVDSPDDIKISFEMGMRMPLLAGAGGKVLLSMLSDAELDGLLSENKPLGSPPNTCANLKECKEIIKKACRDGFLLNDEEYIEGVRALAVPLHLHRAHLQAAIWIAGLKSQIKNEDLPLYTSTLMEIAKKIETRFSLTAAFSGVSHE